MLIKTKKCERCLGEGKIKAVPYFASPMPKEKEYACHVCKGKGIILIVPFGYAYDVGEGFKDYPKL